MKKAQVCTFLLLIIANFSLIAQNEPQTKKLYARIDNYLNEGSKNGFSGAIAADYRHDLARVNLQGNIP